MRRGLNASLLFYFKNPIICGILIENSGGNCKMKRIFNLYFFMAACSLVGIAGIFLINRMDPLRTVSREGVAMDTVIRMTAGAAKNEAEIGEILDEAFEMLDELEKKFSIYGASSDISAINVSSGTRPVTVSRETYEVLAAANHAASLTDGAYDPTIGPVTSCWQEKLSEGAIPSAIEILTAVSRVGFEALSLSAPDTVYLDRPGGMLDLGGIGKGYASAQIGELFRKRGITSALIDLGGNVVVLGGRSEPGNRDRQPWRIGIQDPSKPRGTPICVVEMNEGSVITAGDYERFQEIDGHRYTHIFDPSKGRPIEGGLKSVTIVSNDPALGDALSTAFMVMGTDRAFRLLNVIPGFDAVFVSELESKGYRIMATEGLRNSIRATSGGVPVEFFDVW
jgi:thiamine biosynthesis lipoprotein